MVAFVTARWLTHIYLPVPMPVALTFDFDWRVVSFAVGVSLLTTLLFGLGPALQSVKADVVSSLKETGQSVGTHGARGRTALVMTQAALSTALLVTAAVMVQSVVVPPHSHQGFESDGVLIATFHLPRMDYSRDRGIAFCNQLVERLQRLPGVAAASIMDNIPAANSRPLPYAQMQDSGSDRVGAESVYTFAVSPHHFDVLGIRLLKGRDFAAHDDSGSTPVGIANETLASHFWPGENPTGQHLRTPSGEVIEIVGVAADSKYRSLGEGSTPFLYRPFAQAYFATPTLVVKTSGSVAPVLSAIRNDVTQLDPNVLAYTVMALDDRLALSVLPNRAAAWVAGWLGLGALALGAVGTYGVMALLAQQRRREIGIRMALGALPSDAIRLVAGQGMAWTAAGVSVGLGLAMVSTTLLRRLVFGISSTDPLPYFGVAVFIAGTAGCACYLPARRASLVDPVVALRDE
jgi:predicted permease